MRISLVSQRTMNSSVSLLHCSLLSRIGGKRSKKTSSFLQNEDDPRRSDYLVIQEQISKTKRRVKSLVSAVQVQNEILRFIAKKIDPESSIDHLFSLADGEIAEEVYAGTVKALLSLPRLISSLTLSLSSSFSSTFSQPFKEKYVSQVARIGSMMIFHLSKL